MTRCAVATARSRSCSLRMWQIRCVRAPRDGALRGEADPRLGASLYRHGGDRRRRLRGARPERLHHQHPSRPRPLRRQGPRPEPDDGRDHRPRGRLLPRPRRQHAHHRDRRRACSAPTRSSAGSSALAVGAAHGLRLQGSDGVVVCFFGDGAVEPGHPARGLQPRPPCSTRRWSSSARTTSGRSRHPPSASTRIADIADRAAGYGFPGVIVDGNDVLGGARRSPRRRSPALAPATARR